MTNLGIYCERNKAQLPTSATRQVRQQWFSVDIFPPGLLFDLIGIEDQRKLKRPKSAPVFNLLIHNALKN
jgi:hypothetical protein